MKKSSLILGLSICLFFCGRHLYPSAKDPTQRPFPDSGMVVTVYDGDTIKAKLSDGSEWRVRFIGVDAPEVDDPREEIALRALFAKRFSFFYLFQKKIRLSYDATLLDKHGRLLAYVWTEGEGLFNEFIIRQGFAAAFLAFPFRKEFQERFREAQREARLEKRGFWQEGEPKWISSAEVRSHLGEYLVVGFICSQIKQKKSFVYLCSSDGLFEAVIPRERLEHFPSAQSFLGQSLRVLGFLEEYKSRPQVMLFFPRQLRISGV